MALTGIQAYPIAHGKNNTGGGGTTVINNNGGGSIPSDISINSITAEQGNINTLGGIDLNYDKGTFMEMTSGEGQINNLRGENINYTSGRIAGFQSDNAQIGSLNADEISALKAYIKSLMTDEISTQYLTVTKQAHFFELIIDKVKSAGGTLLLSQAQCVADYVKAVDANGNYLNSLNDPTAQYYDVFFLAKDDKTGRDIRNDWVENDQAYCQSFSNVSSGHSYDVKNKYYWRLVKEILPDTYMNLTTGETTSGNNNVNMVDIRAPYLTYQTGGPQGTTDYGINVGWNISPEGSGAYWSSHPGNIQDASYGYMVTETSDVGIKLTPRAGSSLAQVIPNKFAFGCSSARLNIAVYYVDGASQYFPAPEKDYFIEHPQTSYEVNLTTSTPISKIIITNADDVEWKFVHGIRLSNVSGEYDSNFPNNPNGEQAYIGTSSIPSKGDNIAQLGYRWRYTDLNEDESMKSRGNAIIIAAYRTPDFGTQGHQAVVGIQLSSIKPPSYAQYEAIGSDSSHYFDLAYYRKTYMDANGSKFYGDFYIRAQGQGYENMSDDVSELKVDVQGIQGAVYGTQGTQGLVEQVSYLNQQSDSISLAVQKVYGSVGIKNEFGFNTGAKSYDDADYRTCLMWPYGYGIIGWGRLNRVCQLNIRESVDETWTISCYMKTNAATRINVNFCDINAVRIYKNGEQIELPSGNWVSVGTSYDKWEFIFEHINDVNHGGSTTIGGSWGGFFDFEQYPDSLNTIHVKNIVLTRGEKPNCEFAMAEEDLTYAGSGQDFTWNKGTVTLEAGTFRGYPVYRNTSYPSTGNYLDVFTYDTYTIKDHMPYTLSFWAKASVMNTYIESFMYNNDIHSIPSGVVVDDNFGIDGRWRTYLSTDWQYYTVKWVPDLKTTQWPNDYVKNIIACRISYSSNSQHSGYVYLAGVTLQEGWVEGMGGTTSSLIKQTADEISLSVTNGLQSTGIDITNGKIYLQGNKVEFADSTGGHQGNIWIDPTYGTLHAVNGEFSGNVTATSGSITGQMNVASGGSIIVGEEGSYRIKIAQSSNRGYITMLDGNSNNIILINYDADKGAGQIKFSEANAPRERYTFINPNSMESVYNYKNDNNQWAGDYSHITTQVGRRMAETEYDDLYVTGGLGARRHIKIGLGTTVSGGSEQSVVNLRAYDDNQDSAWPVCPLDTKGANWMDKGHVHVMTMWNLKALLDNPDGIYNSHLTNYAVMLTRIHSN